MKKLSLILMFSLSAMIMPACGNAGEGLIPVTIMLDWVPNTNHTGIFVADARGFFEDAGLKVEIVQPGEVYAEAAVAGGAVDFGISHQEAVTLARADGVPIVSIAAVIQHNTSGFASLASKGITGPKDFEGLTYGAFGSPFESPTLSVLMECTGADSSKLKIQDIGYADPLALLAGGQIGLAWIFYGWQAFQAQQQDIDLDVVMMEDYFDCIPDYYTPLVIASEDTIANRPEVVRAFLKAISRGYDFASQNPDESAEILLAAAPELDGDLVRASQQWLSPRYQADASRWGEQKGSVWQGYSDWMVQYGILSSPISAADAFTNRFLP